MKARNPLSNIQFYMVPFIEHHEAPFIEHKNANCLKISQCHSIKVQYSAYFLTITIGNLILSCLETHCKLQQLILC